MAQIYDQFGRPVTSKRPETGEVAVSWIRDRLLDYPSQWLTPGKLATILKQADQGDIFRQMELFEEMEEKDAHLLSIMQTRKLAVAGLEWEITPTSTSREDKKIAEAAKEHLDSIENFDDSLLHLMDAAGKGFASTEIMWETGKEFRIKELKEVLQRRFTFFNPNFEEDILPIPNVLTPEQPVYGVPMPPYKFVYHVYRAKSGTTPRSALFRPITWLYLFKNYDIKSWVAFCEVYGMPLRIGRYDPATSKEDRDNLVKAVSSLGSDAAAVISKLTEIEISEGVKGTAAGDIFKLFADWCEEGMSKAVLGQTLTMGTGAQGRGSGGGKSLALGKVHDQVRGDIKKADAKALSKTVRNQIIAPIVYYNFGFDKAVPKFRLMADDAKDLDGEINRRATGQKMGYKFTLKDMSETFGWPVAEDGDEILTPIQGGANVNVDNSDESQSSNKASVRIPIPLKAAPPAAPDVVDEMTARLMKEADMGGLMAPVARLVMTASSMEELRDKLLDMYTEMDAADLGALMQRAFTAAELSGRYEANNGR